MPVGSSSLPFQTVRPFHIHDAWKRYLFLVEPSREQLACLERAREKETRVCPSRLPVLSFAHYFQAPATLACVAGVERGRGRGNLGAREGKRKGTFPFLSPSRAPKFLSPLPLSTPATQATATQASERRTILTRTTWRNSREGKPDLGLDQE